MKKFLIIAAALFSATCVSAQVEVNMEKLFTIEDKFIDLNDANTAKDGVAFIGDTRQPEKIQEGKYRGATKDHKVDVTMVPRSCMIQLKPTSDGKLTFCALTNKPEGNNIYIAAFNGTSFRNVATVPVTKAEGDVARKKASPAEAVSCDYTYTAGDELWIYSDGSVSLHAMTFSGQIDNSFTGTDPVSAAKKVKK